MTYGLLLLFVLLCGSAWAIVHNKQFEKKCPVGRKAQYSALPQLGIISPEESSEFVVKNKIEVNSFKTEVQNKQTENKPPWENTAKICLSSLEDATRSFKKHNEDIGGRIIRSKCRIEEIGEKLRLLEERISEEKINIVDEQCSAVGNAEKLASGSISCCPFVGLRSRTANADKRPVKCNIMEKLLEMDNLNVMDSPLHKGSASLLMNIHHPSAKTSPGKRLSLPTILSKASIYNKSPRVNQ